MVTVEVLAVIYTDAMQLAERHCTQMLAVLNVIGSRGIRVDPVRFQQFKDAMQQRLEEIQRSLDANDALSGVRKWRPPQGYKRAPTRKCDECGGKGRLDDGFGAYEPCPPCGSSGKIANTAGMQLVAFDNGPRQKDCSWCAGDEDGLDCVCTTVERWARPVPFNPGSTDQVKAYMRSRGHAVPKTRRGGETSDTNSLLLHWRRYGDPLYKEFVDYRKVAKLLSTYAAWPLTERDGVQWATTKFTLRPITSRLSSTGPNIQNIPKKSRPEYTVTVGGERMTYANSFRRCLVASPGCKLLRADLASAEAVIFAWLCGDPLMMRLATLGMHNFAMSKKLGIAVDLNEPNDTLRQRFGELRSRHKDLYNTVKTCVYGSLYLAGPRTLFEKNPEDFGSMREAKQFQAVVFDAIPQIRVYQQGIVQKRFKYGQDGRNWGWHGNRLYNPFGHSCEFWDMKGQDGPAACAFLPQSIIGCIMKESMLDLWNESDIARDYMRWQIHDELVFDVPVEWTLNLKESVQYFMGRAWPQLGGLRIGVDVKITEDFSQ